MQGLCAPSCRVPLDLSENVLILGSHMKDITPVPPKVHPVAIARQEKNLPREGLAFKAGVSVKTIERIERGEVIPHRTTRRAIAAVLGLDPSELWPTEVAA
jgi:DNA-binding XRE family transcriptional regulator